MLALASYSVNMRATFLSRGVPQAPAMRGVKAMDTFSKRAPASLVGLALLLVCLAPPRTVSSGEMDGSLIVIRGGNKAVAAWTASDVTHVAILVHEHGTPTVYEATPNKVRKVVLNLYQQETAQFKDPSGAAVQVGVMKPREAFTSEQLSAMCKLLASQLGKPYSVRDFVRDSESNGTHCAEFAARALDHSGRFQFPKPYSITPGKLVEILAESYEPAVLLPVPDLPVDRRTWCQKSWDLWGNSFFWCGWACGESWAWCW